MNTLNKGMIIYEKKTKETLEFESLNEGNKCDIKDYLGLEDDKEFSQFYMKSGYGNLQGMYCDGAEFHIIDSVKDLEESISRLAYTKNDHNRRKMNRIKSHLKFLKTLAKQIYMKHHNTICEAKLEILKKHKETIDVIKGNK